MRLYEGMLSGMIVLRRMLVFGRIAASDMSTGQTQSQVNPVIARF
jgi:hypothetical protein